jgi:hypothetical protein
LISEMTQCVNDLLGLRVGRLALRVVS